MTHESPLTKALKAAGTVMTVARDPWWVIASAAVALHGGQAGRVADVDIVLSIDDAMRILPTLGVEPAPGPVHPDFRSDIFGTWHGAAIPVEFMAGFCCRSGTDWVGVQPTTRQAIKVDGVALFVPERAELKRMLERFGRPKDIERARSLDALG